jgi:hypothetical protein
MTRTISYDTENTDDMLWALKRIVEDMFGHNSHSIEMLKKAGEEAIKLLTESTKNL